MARIFKSKLLWAAVIVAALVGLYALVGFKVAPGLVRDQAIKYVKQTYGRELRIGEVRLDPFKLQAEIRDLAFPDADGSPMLGFRRLFVDFELGGFASNGYGEHSPGGYSLASGFLTEVVMTLMFVLIILGATDKRAPAGFAPIAIGLALTLIHLISIPVTNTSVNPARSTGPALIVGGWALAQLWLFWVGPIFGALIAGYVYRWLGSSK